MSNKTEYIQVRVEPRIADSIDVLSAQFDMTKCDVIRAMLNNVLGHWAPFTPEEAQEALLYQGYSPDTTDDGAMTAFLTKHPEEIGAELETLRTDTCILVRRRQDGQAHGSGDHVDGLGDANGSGFHLADSAGIDEVNDG